MLGDAEDLPCGRWRLLGFVRAETQVVEDLPDGHLVGSEGGASLTSYSEEERGRGPELRRSASPASAGAPSCGRSSRLSTAIPRVVCLLPEPLPESSRVCALETAADRPVALAARGGEGGARGGRRLHPPRSALALLPLPLPGRPVARVQRQAHAPAARSPHRSPARSSSGTSIRSRTGSHTPASPRSSPYSRRLGRKRSS